MSTTTINFTMKDLDGTVVPLTDFVISSGRLNTGEIPDVLPADLEFTTDDDGQATVVLEVTNAPYYITKQDGTTDNFISYKFFVPYSATPLNAELLYVDLGKLSTGWNDKSVAALIEAKVVAVNARNQALQYAQVLGDVSDISTSIENITIVAENLDTINLVKESIEQAVDGVKELFVAGTDYTKNTATQLTLSNSPAKSNTVKVWLGGIYQNKDTYWLEGSVVKFGTVLTPEPIAVDTVEIQYEIPSQFVGLTAEDLDVLQGYVDAAESVTNNAQIIVPITTTSHNLVLTDVGKMLRFTATGAKSLHVSGTSSHVTNSLYSVTNRSTSGDLTIVASGSMVFNVPKGGSLILEPGDTVSLHVVSNHVIDIYGSTKVAT